MKSALFACLCFLAGLAGASAATAYNALETIGKQRGEKILDQVTEVRGINGSPQPKEWLISVVDKEARGGVREFGVQGTKITSERTPAGRAIGALMNMNQLNLDSDGAQTIAEREAKKAGFIYTYGDYVLRAGTRGGAPVWELHLVDEKTGDVATFIIAADKGTVLSTEGLNKARTEPPPPEDPRRQAGRGDERRPANSNGRTDVFQRAGESMSHFFDRVGQHLERRGRQIGDKVHNVFTGDSRDTAGPHPGQEGNEPQDARPPAPAPKPQPQPRTYRDGSGTDYYRPRD